jgi:hypothetical protein
MVVAKRTESLRSCASRPASGAQLQSAPEDSIVLHRPAGAQGARRHLIGTTGLHNGASRRVLEKAGFAAREVRRDRGGGAIEVMALGWTGP